MNHSSVYPNSVMGDLKAALGFSLLMLLVCGLVYPFLTTMAAKGLFPEQATGSLIELNGRAIGSEWIAQPFVSEGYFHSRPSTVGYDPMATGGSNLAPSNPALRQRVAEESARIQQLEGVAANAIPVDRLAASGSGLDPHITPASALMQIPRIAKARGMDKKVLEQLVAEHFKGPQWGLFGQPRINVLRLNLALDNLQPLVQQPEPDHHAR